MEDFIAGLIVIPLMAGIAGLTLSLTYWVFSAVTGVNL